METKIKGIIFDWAGTTIDYGCFAPVQVFIDVFGERGIELTLQEAREPMGLLKVDHIRAITKMPRIQKQWIQLHGKEPREEDIQYMYERFEEKLFAILPNFSSPVPGCADLIQRLKKRGMKIGSTTGYTREMMNIIAPKAREQGYAPDTIVTSDEVPAGRPLPWMCYMNAMHLGIYPMSAVIKVGDTAADMKEGRNAGMWTVGVILGSSELGLTEAEVKEMGIDQLEERIAHVRERFMQAGAHFTILELGDLEKVIDVIEMEQLDTVQL